MNLFGFDPVGWAEKIVDEKLKREMEQIGVSAAYSQYITMLYELGQALKGRKLIGWLWTVPTRMAASLFVLLSFQDTEKLIYLSVPRPLVDDTKLQDSIWVEKRQEK
jgi:hypothetical protein